MRGFTLLELLVAMAIFAVISALALGGLNAVVTQQTIAKAQMQRLAELQRALRYLTDDFAQLNPRFVRQVLGDSMDPPLVTDQLGENVVRLSRSGWRNPVPVARGTLQRVQYRIEEEDLIREYWLVMDYPLGVEPRSEVVLEDVTEIEIEYLDDFSRVEHAMAAVTTGSGDDLCLPAGRTHQSRSRRLGRNRAHRGFARMNNKHRQNGVAAITAILVVALASILAVDLAWEMTLDIRRTENMLLRDQAKQIALGRRINGCR